MRSDQQPLAPHHPDLTIPFGDLRRQFARLQPDLEAAALRVLQSGWYVLGREVLAFEQEFAASCGAAYCIGVANGADALYLALVALGVGAGDEVITVANACTYQVDAIVQVGALPVLVDVDPVTQTMAVPALQAALSPRTRAILPVHLYGRLAAMEPIMAVAAAAGVPVVEDAAQAHGAWQMDSTGEPQYAGNWGTLACFSFYPSKNLGALGDGGAVVTSNAALAERVRHLRQYGWSSKYIAMEHGGRNSRLDELQAALLRVKLPHLPRWNAIRRDLAQQYAAALAGTPLILPADEPGHVYHLYVVVAGSMDERDQLRAHLHRQGIGSDIHYPLPAHLQPAYSEWRTPELPMLKPQGAGTLPHTEALAQRILSLPLYPEMEAHEVQQVAAAVRAFYGV